MIEQEFIDIPDMILLLKMKDRREYVDIPDMILLLKIKKECSEHSTSHWKIVLNNRLFAIVAINSIGDKFFRFEKLLIMYSILVFYLP